MWVSVSEYVSEYVSDAIFYISRIKAFEFWLKTSFAFCPSQNKASGNKDLSVIAKLSILIKLEGKDGCITSSATRCRIKKVAQMFPNFGYKVTTSFSH